MNENTFFILKFIKYTGHQNQPVIFIPCIVSLLIIIVLFSFAEQASD